MAKPQHAARSRPSKSTKKAAPPPSVWARHRPDLWVVGLGVLGVFVALAEFRWLGPVGRGLSAALADLFGMVRWLIPLTLLVAAGGLLIARVTVERSRLIFGFSLATVGACGLAHFLGGSPALHASEAQLGGAGGYVGVLVGGGLKWAIGVAGAVVILLAALTVASLLLTGLTLRAVATSVGQGGRRVLGAVTGWRAAHPREPREPKPARERRAAPVIDEPVAYDEYDAEEEAPLEEEWAAPIDEFDEIEPAIEPEPTAAPPAHAAPAGPPAHATGEWTLPPLELLHRAREQRLDRAAADAAGDELVSALAAHGVETTLVGYTVGPTVTRYELELGPGVKVAQLTSLHRDIAYAMASPDVRILAPIPGRSAIGVEVPNRQRVLVTLGDLLASEEAVRSQHPLDVPLGRDITGQTVVANLAEMPHVLISGATGAGKSSCINSIITSLVMRATPDQLRLILVDPKRVELGQYNDLPHLLAPVVVDPRKAAATLTWAVKEMERRYDLLAQHQVRDITSYHQQLGRGELREPFDPAAEAHAAVERGSQLELDFTPADHDPLPYIVIVVDELNDLMLVAARDVEDSVVRIAQMARAVGIHLVLATQRPSVDVITGVIKANIPSRMAFAVSSLADSRVILDQAGAERLIGKGDVLLLTASSNVARRLQSPWVSEEEVRQVVANWRAQGGQTESVVAIDDSARTTGGIDDGADEDDGVMLARARELVLRTQSGSTSMLQRKLRVGFARAGRLMDQLENEGVVAAGEGSKSRRVLLTLEQYEAGAPARGA